MPPPSDVASIPQVSRFTKFLVTAMSLLMSAYAFYEMRIRGSALDDRLKAVVESRRYPENPNILIHATYTGIHVVDYGLRFLVTAFLPGVTGFYDPAAFVLSLYFLMSFSTLLMIYTVEAGKIGARGGVIYFTSIWAIFYQTVGGAVIIPILHLYILRQSWKKEYFSNHNRLPIHYASALWPSIVFGYILPTYMMYSCSGNLHTVLQQKLIAFWQITPFVVNILLVVLQKVFATLETKSNSWLLVLVRSFGETSQGCVKFTSGVCMMVSIFTHVYVLWEWYSKGLSFTRIFVPQAHMLEHGVADPLHYIFQIDFAVIFAAGLMMAFVALLPVRNAGKRKISGVELMLGLLFGSVLMGPAASVNFAFMLRDNLASETHSKETEDRSGDSTVRIAK